MEAKELRIGNYVTSTYDLNELITVDTISNFGINDDIVNGYEAEFDFIKTSEWHIKPIPLTEEWLIKFGLKDTGHNGIHILKLNEDTQLRITLNNGGTTAMVHPTKEGLISTDSILSGNVIIPMHCEYVHQLQNLFYSLSGEELTIK